MRKAVLVFTAAVFCSSLIYCQSQQNDSKVMSGPYLGQKPPGMVPEIFAPDIISSKEFKEFSIAFSPDGCEIFFYRLYENYDAKIFYCKENDGKWTAPEEFSVTAEYPSFIPCFTFDNDILFFAWRKPVSDADNNEASMWLTKRTPDGWTKPVCAGRGMYLSSTAAGELFTGLRDSESGNYIAKVSFKNGAFIEYEKQIIEPLNGEQAHPCVALDGSYILFDRGGDHLSISFKLKDGTWGPAVNLWEHGFDPIAGLARISPDGKYLFFKQGSGSNRDIYWVSTKILEKLKPME